MEGLTPDLYDRHARAWAEQRGRTFREGSWLDRFTAGLREGAGVLDLGSGSGWPIGAELLRRGFAVTGLEASPALAGMARESLPLGRWIVGDMRTADLGETFAGVLAWHSLFHLAADDQRAMFDRFAGLCEPGAALMFTSGSQAGTEMGEWMGEPLHHASLDPAEYRRLLTRAGFQVIQHVAEDPACGGATVWLAQSVKGRAKRPFRVSGRAGRRTGPDDAPGLRPSRAACAP